MVRVIRTYRPLVIYSRFAGNAGDGHGHHQLAGKLTPMAYKAAADPAQFPELAKEGLRPWQARKLYRGVGFRPGAGRRGDDAGRDGAVRSAHRPQLLRDRGRGPQPAQDAGDGVARVAGPAAVRVWCCSTASRRRLLPETSVFDGLDTSLPGSPALVGLPAGALSAELTAVDRLAAQAVSTFDARNPAAVVPKLAEALTQIRGGADGPGRPVGQRRCQGRCGLPAGHQGTRRGDCAAAGVRDGGGRRVRRRDRRPGRVVRQHRPDLPRAAGRW